MGFAAKRLSFLSPNPVMAAIVHRQNSSRFTEIDFRQTRLGKLQSVAEDGNSLAQRLPRQSAAGCALARPST